MIHAELTLFEEPTTFQKILPWAIIVIAVVVLAILIWKSIALYRDLKKSKTYVVKREEKNVVIVQQEAPAQQNEAPTQQETNAKQDETPAQSKVVVVKQSQSTQPTQTEQPAQPVQPEEEKPQKTLETRGEYFVLEKGVEYNVGENDVIKSGKYLLRSDGYETFKISINGANIDLSGEINVQLADGDIITPVTAAALIKPCVD